MPILPPVSTGSPIRARASERPIQHDQTESNHARHDDAHLAGRRLRAIDATSAENGAAPSFSRAHGHTEYGALTSGQRLCSEDGAKSRRLSASCLSVVAAEDARAPLQPEKVLLQKLIGEIRDKADPGEVEYEFRKKLATSGLKLEALIEHINAEYPLRELVLGPKPIANYSDKAREILSHILRQELVRSSDKRDPAKEGEPTREDFEKVLLAWKNDDSIRFVVKPDDKGKVHLKILDGVDSSYYDSRERGFNRDTINAFVKAFGGKDFALLAITELSDEHLYGEAALCSKNIIDITELESRRDNFISGLFYFLNDPDISSNFNLTQIENIIDRINRFDQDTNSYGRLSFIEKLKLCVPGLDLPEGADLLQIANELHRYHERGGNLPFYELDRTRDLLLGAADVAWVMEDGGENFQDTHPPLNAFRELLDKDDGRGVRLGSMIDGRWTVVPWDTPKPNRLYSNVERERPENIRTIRAWGRALIDHYGEPRMAMLEILEPLYKTGELRLDHGLMRLIEGQIKEQDLAISNFFNEVEDHIAHGATAYQCRWLIDEAGYEDDDKGRFTVFDPRCLVRVFNERYEDNLPPNTNSMRLAEALVERHAASAMLTEP